MSELRLVGLHEDGEHVVLEGPDGQRFRLSIDEALRAAVRRDRPQLEKVRAVQTGAVPPREIQARIRAGATAEEVAESSGMPVEMVRRYEGPVLAERQHIAAQAGATRIGRETGAPVLGDLVTDRLATRGVDAASVRWDAYRVGTSPWTVEVRFGIGGTERSARWTYEGSTRSIKAVDDEARWLSETDLADEPIPRRHLAAVPTSQGDVALDAALRPVLASVDEPVEAAEPEPDEDPTQSLLDDLNDRRGLRQPVDDEGEEEAGEPERFEGFGPQHAFDFENPDMTVPSSVPAAHPPASRPDLAVDAQVLAMPSGPREAARPAAGEQPSAVEDVPAPLAGRSRSRKGRASVPSWDEIVFGAKPE